MRLVRRALIILALFAFAVPAIAAETETISTPKKRDILRLLQLNGGAAYGDKILKTLLPAWKKAYPKVPETVWKEALSGVSGEELTERIVPVWDKNFSETEIKELVRFYETPTGQKLLTTMPLVSTQTVSVGHQWGSTVSERLRKTLAEKGYASAPPKVNLPVSPLELQPAH